MQTKDAQWFTTKSGSHKFLGDGFTEFLAQLEPEDITGHYEQSSFGIAMLYGRHILIEDDRGFVNRMTFGRHTPLTVTTEGQLCRLSQMGTLITEERLGQRLAKAVFDAYDWLYISETDTVSPNEAITARRARYLAYALRAADQGVLPHSYHDWRGIIDAAS